ncbi:unnamed protein product [Linum trigynum]
MSVELVSQTYVGIEASAAGDVIGEIASARGVQRSEGSDLLDPIGGGDDPGTAESVGDELIRASEAERDQGRVNFSSLYMIVVGG